MYLLSEEKIMSSEYLSKVYLDIESKYPYQKEYLQVVRELIDSLGDVIESNEKIKSLKIFERLIEPDRLVSFKVAWVDDKGIVQINKGYRVQFNNAIGPYKGGLRFTPSVNESIIKFLGLEQCFKNALTGLPLGGGKGGSDFDPKGKSDHEIMSFCQAFMNELYNYIGASIDVPAGDIGVGGREIGFLYGQYKKLTHANESVLTGKPIVLGGSYVRKEATGYGLCYFTAKALEVIKNTSFKDKIVVVSGSGNVAIYAAEKSYQLGAKVVAMSDSNGVIYDKDGIDLDVIKEIKEVKRGRIKEYLELKKRGEFFVSPASIWKIKCDIALPCATQNELNLDDAKVLVDNGVIAVCEGANMPCTLEASNYFISHSVLYGPAKASNAGGVATSGLEMSQNAIRLHWTPKEVDEKLKTIMEDIFFNIYNTAKKYDLNNNLLAGANIFAFEMIAEAMIDQGV